jgi:hypothetical protein
MLTRFQANDSQRYYNYGVRCFVDGQKKDIGFDLPTQHRPSFFKGYEDALRADLPRRRHSVDEMIVGMGRIKLG